MPDYEIYAMLKQQNFALSCDEDDVIDAESDMLYDEKYNWIETSLDSLNGIKARLIGIPFLGWILLEWVDPIGKFNLWTNLPSI